MLGFLVVSVGADKPNENQNINDNNSIPQNKEKDSPEGKKNHFGNNCQNNIDNLDKENINYEKLAYESLEGDKLKEEMERAKSIAIISSQIIQTNNLVLKAYKAKQESMSCDFEIPKMLKG